MVTRKQTPKQTVVDTPFVETVHSAAPDSPDTLEARMHAAVNEMFSGSVVSWKRILLAWVVGLAAGFGVSYVLTSLAMYAAVGALLLSGSAFISVFIYVVGIIAAIYAGYRASVFAHLKIIDKSVDAAFLEARHVVADSFNSVRGWFGNKPVAA